MVTTLAVPGVQFYLTWWAHGPCCSAATGHLHYFLLRPLLPRWLPNNYCCTFVPALHAVFCVVSQAAAGATSPAGCGPLLGCSTPP